MSGMSKSSRPARARSSGGNERRPSIRVGKRILDRQSHVGNAQLRDDRAVSQLDHRMNDRLRMNDHIDVIGAHAEQPVSLDHFEAFVHECCRVDCDLAPHPPGWMAAARRLPLLPTARATSVHGMARRKRSESTVSALKRSGHEGIDEWRCARCRQAGEPHRGAGQPP